MTMLRPLLLHPDAFFFSSSCSSHPSVSHSSLSSPLLLFLLPDRGGPPASLAAPLPQRQQHRQVRAESLLNSLLPSRTEGRMDERRRRREVLVLLPAGFAPSLSSKGLQDGRGGASRPRWRGFSAVMQLHGTQNRAT